MNLSLPMRPRIKRHLLATTIENDNIIVLAEDNAWLWKSSALALLLPQLTGEYTVSELFELLGARMKLSAAGGRIGRRFGHQLIPRYPARSLPRPRTERPETDY